MTVEAIFQKYLERSKEGLTWADTGQRWYYCSCCIFCKHTGEPLTRIEVLPGKVTNETVEKDPLKCYPENLFNKAFKIGGEIADCIIGDGFAVSLETGEVKKHQKLSHVHLRHYMLLVPEAVEYLKEKGGELGILKKRLSPLIHLTEGHDHLYLVMGQQTFPETLKFTHEGETYQCVRWNERTKAYAKLEKENSMANISRLPSMVKQVATTLDMSEEQIKKEAGIEEELTEAQMLEALGKEVPAAEVPVEAAVEAAVEAVVEVPVEEAPVEDAPPFETDNAEAPTETVTEVTTDAPAVTATDAPAEESKEEPIKAAPKKRVRAAKARCSDLTDVITQVSSDVPEDMSQEDVMKEVRQMRDLIIAASRRQANLALRYLDKGSEAETILQQLKGILK